MNYLIDPTFTKVNSLFFGSIEKENDRIYFSKCYTPSPEAKYFNVLIDKKLSFLHSYKR